MKESKMKVAFKYGIGGYIGKFDDMVFCYNRSLGKLYARRRAYPTITESHRKFGSITANLFALKPSQAYKDDLSFYGTRYRSLRNTKGKLITWTNLYIKLMYEMARQDTTIDLKTLSREEIYSRDLPCISIEKGVEAGLLPAVRNYASYANEL